MDLLAHFINRIDPIPVQVNEKIDFLKGKSIDLLIQEHLAGSRRVGALNICEDSTIKWAAIDIDSGPTKKYPLRYPKKVALKILRTLMKHGIQGYLEKSFSGDGYHIWIFFTQPLPAHFVRDCLFTLLPFEFELDRELGYVTIRSNRGLELFPKQDFGSLENPGNFLWLPYFGAATDDKNQFGQFIITGTDEIDPNENNIAFEVIPSPTFTKTDVNTLLQIPLTENTVSLPSIKGTQFIAQKYKLKEYPPFKIKTILEGCEVFAKLVTSGKCTQLGHYEGFFLISILARFEKGIERFNEVMLNWGKSRKQRHQITKYAEKYGPWTCRKAQENGVCPHRNHEHCLKTVDLGREPSPISFANLYNDTNFYKNKSFNEHMAQKGNKKYDRNN